MQGMKEICRITLLKRVSAVRIGPGAPGQNRRPGGVNLLACFLGRLFSFRASTMPQTFNFCRLHPRFRGCSRSCLSLRFTHLSGSSRWYRTTERRIGERYGAAGARSVRGAVGYGGHQPPQRGRPGVEKTVRYTCLCRRGAGSAIKKTPWAKTRWPVLVSRLSYVAPMPQTSISAMKKPRCGFEPQRG